MPSDDDGGAQRPMRSAANYVEGPKKNRYLVKWSRFYSTKIPMGVREFVFTGPLLIIVFSIAYFIPELVDVSKFTQGLAPHTQDMREYTLEPMYDEKGQLKGYRHINRKERGGASDEQGQQSVS